MQWKHFYAECTQKKKARSGKTQNNGQEKLLQPGVDQLEHRNECFILCTLRAMISY